MSREGVSTGATPASLMFGKEIRTKLPELRPEKSLRDESMRDKDWEQKLKQKAYADGNCGAVPSPIVPGDQVLLKNTRETGKLAPKVQDQGVYSPNEGGTSSNRGIQ